MAWSLILDLHHDFSEITLLSQNARNKKGDGHHYQVSSLESKSDFAHFHYPKLNSWKIFDQRQ